MVENKISLLNRILLILLKYIPIFQLITFLLNNTIYVFYENYGLACLFDIISGNSLLFIILLYILSYRFNYCIWHRLIILGNLINFLITCLDILFTIPVGNITLLIIYWIVYAIFISIASYLHIKGVHHEREIINIKKSSSKNN